MKTIILLAGHATRMRPLSNYLNKGMIPVNGRPLLEWVVGRLAAQGFTDLLVAVTMFPEQLQHYFGDGSRFGVRMAYVARPEPAQTAGEVFALREHIASEEDFVVHYGDILTTLDLQGLVARHRASGAIATLGLVTEVALHAGVAEVAPDGRVTRFVEKPPLPLWCNAAVGVYNRRVLEYCGPNKDFGNHVLPELIAAGENVQGFCDAEADWLDVGRLSDLDEAAALTRKWEGA